MTEKVYKIEKWIKEKIACWCNESQCEVPELSEQIIEGKILALREMLSFINSLQEEPISEDLEEAAKNHAVERFRTTRDAFLAEKCKWSFIAGAQWRLDSLWHDISEKQPKELETVIYNGKKWCSLSDILSMTKDKKI